jgi:hypothetical protein
MQLKALFGTALMYVLVLVVALVVMVNIRYGLGGYGGWGGYCYLPRYYESLNV